MALASLSLGVHSQAERKRPENSAIDDVPIFSPDNLFIAISFKPQNPKEVK